MIGRPSCAIGWTPHKRELAAARESEDRACAQAHAVQDKAAALRQAADVPARLGRWPRLRLAWRGSKQGATRADRRPAHRLPPAQLDPSLIGRVADVGGKRGGGSRTCGGRGGLVSSDGAGLERPIRPENPAAFRPVKQFSAFRLAGRHSPSRQMPLGARANGEDHEENF